MKDEKTKKMAVGSLIVDFSIYPRSDVDSQHITYMQEAEDSGVKLPPIIIERKSKRVVDGVHRTKMYQRKYGDEHLIEVIEKDYANEAYLFLDAVRCNASHGRTLTRHDRTHCILLSEKLKVPQDELASALSMKVEKIGKLRVERVGELRVGKTFTPIPLKRTISHMHGRKLTKRQSEANDRLSGMNQSFYVNQLITLIDSGLLDMNNENLMERLKVLYQALEKLNINELVNV